jgi:hypothetical protein
MKVIFAIYCLITFSNCFSCPGSFNLNDQFTLYLDHISDGNSGTKKFDDMIYGPFSFREFEGVLEIPTVFRGEKVSVSLAAYKFDKTAERNLLYTIYQINFVERNISLALRIDSAKGALMRYDYSEFGDLAPENPYRNSADFWELPRIDTVFRDVAYRHGCVD